MLKSDPWRCLGDTICGAGNFNWSRLHARQHWYVSCPLFHSFGMVFYWLQTLNEQPRKCINYVLLRSSHSQHSLPSHCSVMSVGDKGQRRNIHLKFSHTLFWILPVLSTEVPLCKLLVTMHKVWTQQRRRRGSRKKSCWVFLAVPFPDVRQDSGD